MNVITPGHRYELPHFEPNIPKPNLIEPDRQTIQFIEKAQDLSAPVGQMVQVNNGTTNEDVLAVLIDRLNYLQGKFPCRENAVALTHIETALLWLNKRTTDRKARGVEGKALK